MAIKTAIILLASIILVIAEPQEYKVVSPYHNRSPPRVRQQTGASRIFEWIGSRFARIPYFLPRVPQFPKYASPKIPEYQTVVLPEAPGTPDYKLVESPQEDLNIIQDTQGHDPPSFNPATIIESNSPPSYNFVNQNEIKVNNNPGYEVVPSQMISYEQEIMPPANGGWQPGFGGIPPSPIPIQSPPVHQNPQAQSQVPVVPQSMGPDYFNTAYGHENQDKFQQQSQSQHTQSSDQPIYQAQQQYNYPAHNQNQGQPEQNFQSSQSYAANSNFGASFTDIQQQAPAATGSAAAGSIIELSAEMAAQHPSPQNGYTSAGFDLNQADFGTLLSSLDSTANNFVAGSEVVSVATHPPKPNQQNQKSNNGYVASGIPGVKILSQSEDGGNPVFEVLADADAPSFGGHPFDINKLIAMIEPGAELVDAPQLSESASETKNVYTVAPAASSGISDLLLSESRPETSVSTIDNSTSISSSKNKKPFFSFITPNKNESDKNKSSLKEIMDFFQQTGGKGYVVVEKKRSPQNTGDNLSDALTHDDELTDGFSRLNITSESLPLLNLLDKETSNPFTYNIIPLRDSTAASPINKFKLTSPNPTKSYSFKPSGSRKLFQSKFNRHPFISSTVKFANLTSPTVFFAVRATTQHPNHNYNSTFHLPYPLFRNANVFPSVIPTVNTLIDSVRPRTTLNSDLISIPTTTKTPISDDDDEDLAAEESSQVKSIAITVTPPPHLTTTTPTASPTSTSKSPFPISVPVTKKSVSSSTSSKKRPAPVYRRSKQPE